MNFDIDFNKKKKDMTNTEFMVYVMQIGGRTGALKQAMITQAVHEYVDKVVKDKEELLKEEQELKAQGKIPFISYSGWVACAEELKELFDEKYES